MYISLYYMGQFEIQTGFRRAERESYMLLFERIRYCKSVIVCMPLHCLYIPLVTLDVISIFPSQY